MAAWLTTLLRAGLQILYPGACLRCGAPLPLERSAFCAGCERLFADPHETCPRCAATVGPYSVHDGACVGCRNEPPAFDAASRMGPYEAGVGLAELIVRLKFASHEWLAELVGETW